ncbi:reverse transcriptase family protein [Thalassobius sp. I31.1]|uniref:reverse transcriptase family protein n=1 Tax=Thalassobius sp. I31.1 TaxID=2109912 RepID=UPI0013006285|nr:reverse transcriptase family protein [Thalassobius sp. I31.1]
MNRTQFALSLAPSLLARRWSETELSQCLLQRLPGPQKALSERLAAELLQIFPGPVAPPERQLVVRLRDRPTFERLYRHCAKKAIWPAPVLTETRMQPASGVGRPEVPHLDTPGDFAAWLPVPVDRLNYLADVDGRYACHAYRTIRHYHAVAEPKKSGGLRLIEAPKSQLKAVQRQILQGILRHIPVHEAAYGFAPDKGCADAARLHCGHDEVVCFDLADFFPSVSFSRVFGVFRHLGYPEAVTRLLAGLCTTETAPDVRGQFPFAMRQLYRIPHLPQGAPTSPALADILLFNLDCRLNALSAKLGASYTRYADDLTFSGQAGLGRGLLKLVPEIIRDEGFRSNPGKARVMPSGGRQVVTGIVVNAHLNMRRAEFDQLKAEIHACGRPGDLRLSDPHYRARLIGRIQWLRHLNPARGEKLLTLLGWAEAQKITA